MTKNVDNILFPKYQLALIGLLEKYTKKEMARRIGISRPTLDSLLQTENSSLPKNSTCKKLRASINLSTQDFHIQTQAGLSPEIPDEILNQQISIGTLLTVSRSKIQIIKEGDQSFWIKKLFEETENTLWIFIPHLVYWASEPSRLQTILNNKENIEKINLLTSKLSSDYLIFQAYNELYPEGKRNIQEFIQRQEYEKSQVFILHKIGLRLFKEESKKVNIKLTKSYVTGSHILNEKFLLTGPSSLNQFIYPNTSPNYQKILNYTQQAWALY